MPKKSLKKVFKDPKVGESFGRIAVMAIILVFLILFISIIRRSFLNTIDPEKHVYFEIILLLLMAVLAEVAVSYFKIQNVLTLMILGIILSPSFMNILWALFRAMHLATGSSAPIIFTHEEVINVFAQLGAIILLFKVGMHSKIEKIFSKENLLVALVGIILPFFSGYLYAMWTGNNFIYSMFLGATLAATSVGVTVAVLKELKVLEKRFSEIIIGAAILDDILSLLVLSVVVNISEAQGNAAFNSVIITFIGAVIFIVGALVSGKYVVKYIDRKELGQKRFLLSLAFMLTLSYFAEVIKLSAIVGAFLAGIILSKSRHYEKLEDKTSGLEIIFMPIFFISLGMLVDVNELVVFFVPIIIITLIAFISKIIGCGLMSMAAKLNLRESLLVGIGMVPRGEVALIIASIGLTKGILSQSEYSIISAMAIITTILVPPILSALIKKTAKKTPDLAETKPPIDAIKA